MLTFGKKMLDFPSNSDSFMRLAGRNMQSGEYDNVIELCCRARAACPDDFAACHDSTGTFGVGKLRQVDEVHI